MCTITLVPHPDSINGFILTSNRDEAVSRKTSPPAQSVYKGKKLFFPTDEKAGGTWIGVSEKLRCICLINGAEKPHTRKPDYRKSRGVVVKDFLAAKRLKDLFKNYNLENIEPFTMIVVDWHNGLAFYEFVWDEKERRLTELEMKEHIWSSSPLYSDQMKASRVKWFKGLKESKGFSSESLLNFHHHGGEGSDEFDLVIDRGFLKTQSITQVHNSTKELKFWYKNLVTQEVKEDYLQFNT